MIYVLIVQGAANVVLAVLCWRMYRDVLGMAREVAGMPPVMQDKGNARIISPYKQSCGATHRVSEGKLCKKEGDGS